MEQKSNIVVIGVLKYENGDILLSQRFEPINPLAHLKWELPGGKNRFGESLEKTLLREVKEETGLDIEIQYMLPKGLNQLWQYPTFIQHKLVFCYVAKIVGRVLHTKDPKIAAHLRIKPEYSSSQDLLARVPEFIELYLRTRGNNQIMGAYK